MLGLVSDSDFVEWEYTFENVYMPAYLDLQRNIHRLLMEYLANQE